MKKSLLIVALFYSLLSFGTSEYKFRVQLKDKGTTSFSLDSPIEYLSQRAIDRRVKQAIKIDSCDLPISAQYLQEIENLGGIIVAKSKWVKTVSVHSADSTIADRLKNLPFVKDVSLVWVGGAEKTRKSKDFKRIAQEKESSYGLSYEQIAIHDAIPLHEQGFAGEGMEIAVIDAGFKNLETIPYTDNISIRGIKDFVYQGDDMMTEGSDHGLSVLSCMATNQPGTYIGTAPKAKYWLLRTEDIRSEYPIEEDYWISAIEYADSVGVDLVNSSLGYSFFQIPIESHKFEELDGKTTLISQAAQMATDKGIFVVSSAGNEGATNWGKITLPGDAPDVLTVGAIAQDSIVASFSSRGPTADLRIKPDVVAIGQGTKYINSDGYIVSGNGTSFSSPIMCGLVACLWQANPNLTNKQILNIVRTASHMHATPNEIFGYGIPDMKIALNLALNQPGGSGIDEYLVTSQDSHFWVKSLHRGQISIEPKTSDGMKYNISIVTADGHTVLKDSFSHYKEWNVLSHDRKFYIVLINNDNSGVNERRKLLF